MLPDLNYITKALEENKTIGSDAPRDLSARVSATFFEPFNFLKTESSFNLSSDYVLEVAYNGIPWFVSGAVIATLLSAILALKATRLQENPEESAQPGSFSWRFIIVLALRHSIAFFIALGLIGRAVIIETAFDLLESIYSASSAVIRKGSIFLDLAAWMTDQMIEFNPSLLEDSFLTSLFSAIQGHAPRLFPNVAPLSRALAFWHRMIADAAAIAQKSIKGVSGVFALILVIHFLALGVLFSAFQSKRFIFIVKLSFLIIVALFSWAELGAIALAGIVTSDICMLLSDYHLQLQSDGRILSSPKFLADALPCQPASIGQSLDGSLSRVANALLSQPLAIEAASKLLNTTAPKLTAALEWGFSEAIELVDCSLIADVSKWARYAACDAGFFSFAGGIFQLWVGLLGLSILLPIAFAEALFRRRAAPSATFGEPNALSKNNS